MGRLTTHVLDTSNGRPAAGMEIDLYRVEAEHLQLAEAITNSDGRVNTPLLEGDDFIAGEYELVFHAGDYFNRGDPEPTQARFLDRVVIRFSVADASEHYHVPLLLSPFGYSTYRGS